MKKVFALLFASLAIFAIVATAKADGLPVVETFDTGYRVVDSNGNYYLTSNQEHVLACSGAFLTSPNKSVKCPAGIYLDWMKVFHAGTKFAERMATIAGLK